ncbi:hypothetical protein ZWY2020_057688 [Hordeum vulgare]|nr:hypothetical protein ZWY2020_057688 [Hordeum vulgare]
MRSSVKRAGMLAAVRAAAASGRRVLTPVQPRAACYLAQLHKHELTRRACPGCCRAAARCRGACVRADLELVTACVQGDHCCVCWQGR